jgi:hypothetical protein
MLHAVCCSRVHMHSCPRHSCSFTLPGHQLPLWHRQTGRTGTGNDERAFFSGAYSVLPSVNQHLHSYHGKNVAPLSPRETQSRKEGCRIHSGRTRTRLQRSSVACVAQQGKRQLSSVRCCWLSTKLA